MNMFKLALFLVAITVSFTQCVSNLFAAPNKPAVASKAPATATKANVAAKRLQAKLESQALIKARAQLIREDEIRARARLEALEELNSEAEIETDTVEAVPVE